jgi:hypothetical protein
MRGKQKPAAKLKQRARSAGVQHACQTMPVVVKCEPLFSKKFLGETPYAHLINVACAYAIKDKLKETVMPKFYWSGKFWVTLVRTKKMYDLAFSTIVDAARHGALPVDDERGVWLPTTCYVHIDVFEDQDGAYARLNGATFEYREQIKKSGGRFCGTTKDWEVSTASLLQVLEALLEDGVPVFGTFNFDGVFAEVLAKAKYKQVSPPQCIELDDDAEFWAME